LDVLGIIRYRKGGKVLKRCDVDVIGHVVGGSTELWMGFFGASLTVNFLGGGRGRAVPAFGWRFFKPSVGR
jgi:hypothetical protein